MIPVLIQQAQNWPPNFNANVIVPALSTLVLQIQQNGTKILLLIASIAQSYVWCQDLLEHTMQELENLLYEGRVCLLDEDIVKDSSQKMLLSSCFNGQLREQQTAVRLILLFGEPFVFVAIRVIVRNTNICGYLQPINRRSCTTPQLSI